jgi:hypothetical protein
VNIKRKPDSKRIQEHVKKLKERAWLGEARAWWPDYLFRFDDIRAAAQILNDGRILSRAAAVASGVMTTDCASPEVIASTEDRWKQFARLYFRPRTPTQYDSEGFRPSTCYILGAHCPAPVVMLFDAVDVLTRIDTKFSNGNLAAKAATGDDAAFLASIPFEAVYHDSRFDPSEKATIIFHRHAEVIVPDELELSPMRFVGCRTQAEYETLLHLLKPKAREQWSAKIGLGTKANLHYRRWTFVEQVELSREKIRFHFNPSSRTPGPFSARVSIRELETDDEYIWEDNSYSASSTLEINLQNLKHPESYEVRLELDGRLAYSNSYEEEDIPF